MVSLSKILKKGRAIYLAYDQGMEHGTSDFDERNVDPLYILDIARRGKFSAVIFQKGVAEKYRNEIKKSGVNLIVKLNGKTNLVEGEPLSRQLCTVKEAVRLGAVAVGYTIYLGSEHESVMLQEFEGIVRSAHKINLPVIAWIYPRGIGTKGKSKAKLMAYAARAGLELGADIVKLNYNGNLKDLKWAVESAGRCKIVVAGGVKKNERILLKRVREIMKSGSAGLAVGRNVWQAENPLAVAKKLSGLVWKK